MLARSTREGLKMKNAARDLAANHQGRRANYSCYSSLWQDIDDRSGLLQGPYLRS